MPRISVDKVYMQMAYQTAKLSYAERRRVGCIIVKDEQIVSFGYNGTPHGFDNRCEEDDNRFYENPDDALDLIEQGFVCENGCCHKPDAITKNLLLYFLNNL